MFLEVEGRGERATSRSLTVIIKYYILYESAMTAAFAELSARIVLFGNFHHDVL